MKSLKEFLDEGNKLAHLVGQEFGTVSPETGDTTTRKTKRIAHTTMKNVLRKLSDSGAISFTGAHAGRYKYSGTEAPAKEGSYLLKPGKDARKAKHFDRILRAVGSRFKQQSVLHVDKEGTGTLEYTGGEAKGTKEPMGKLHFNQTLKTGSGDTKLRGKNASFTVQE